MLREEAAVFWARFSAMLVGHSILVIAIATLLSRENPPRPVIGWLALTGLLLCVVWLALTQRSTDYQRFHAAAAKEAEKVLVSPKWRVFTKGDRFANDGTREFGVTRSAVRGTWVGKAWRGTVATVTLFVAIYTLLFTASVVAYRW